MTNSEFLELGEFDRIDVISIFAVFEATYLAPFVPKRSQTVAFCTH